MNRLTHLTRQLTRAAAWVAVVLLMACSVTIDSEGETQSRALIDRLPAGATAIAWIDIEALAETLTAEEWEEYEDMIEEDDATMERFIEATGLDPRTDMHQVGAAVMPDGSVEDPWVVLMSADFDEDKLLALAEDAESVEYEGATFYWAPDVFEKLDEAVEFEADENMEVEVDGDDDGWLAILDDRTLALGTEESLRTIVDVEGGRHDALKDDPDMNDLISDVAGRGQIWFVATSDTWDDRVDDLGSQGGGMVPTSAIENIDVMTMSMRMGDGMSMRVAGITATEEAATELVTSLNGLLAIGRMMLQQNEPELFSIIDRGISVGQDGNAVHIEATLTEADLEILQRMAEEQMPQGDIGQGS